MDVWTIEGMDAQELSEALQTSFKEKAMAGGAKIKTLDHHLKLEVINR